MRRQSIMRAALVGLALTAIAVLPVLSQPAPVRAAHVWGPGDQASLMAYGPITRPFDDPNYAYNFGTPGQYAKGSTWIQIRDAWCNHGTPTVYSHLKDLSTGAVGGGPLPILTNQCESDVDAWSSLRQGDTYQYYIYDLVHGTASPTFTWVQ